MAKQPIRVGNAVIVGVNDSRIRLLRKSIKVSECLAGAKVRERNASPEQIELVVADIDVWLGTLRVNKAPAGTGCLKRQLGARAQYRTRCVPQHFADI